MGKRPSRYQYKTNINKQLVCKVRFDMCIENNDCFDINFLSFNRKIKSNILVSYIVKQAIFGGDLFIYFYCLTKNFKLKLVLR